MTSGNSEFLTIRHDGWNSGLTACRIASAVKAAAVALSASAAAHAVVVITSSNFLAAPAAPWSVPLCGIG